MARQRRPQFGLGLLLLLHKVSSQTIPPVTLAAIVGMSLLFTGVISPPWDRYDVCLSGEGILVHRDYRCLLLSALEHSSDIHLYHNMASLVLKGRTLEGRFGSVKFLVLLVVFTVASSGAYVGLVWAAAQLLEDYSYMRQCAIGFSGVLFALKVLTTYDESRSQSYIYGIQVPTKYSVWAELVIIHILVPRASFIGHLAGILVGLAYMNGPLEALVNLVTSLVIGTTGRGASYTYMHGTTGGAEGPPPQRSRYGWNVGDSDEQPSPSHNHHSTSHDSFHRPSAPPYDYPSAPPYQPGDHRSRTPDYEELRQRRLHRYQ